MSTNTTVSNSTLEYFDGFDDYDSAQLPRYWSGQWNSGGNNFGQVAWGGNLYINTGTGRNGTNSLRINANQNGFYQFLTSQATRTVGCAFNFLFFPTGETGLISLLDGVAWQLAVGLNSAGTIYVARGGYAATGAAILATSSKVISPGIWFYLEFSSVINSTTGSFTVKVNGVQWLIGSALNTQATSNSSASGVAVGGSSNFTSGLTIDYDDFYSRADGVFCGDCRVESLLPSGNGTTIQMTPGGTTIHPSNYQQVDDNPSDDDTTYNIAGSAGLEDEYTYPALITATGNVQAVMTVPIMRTDSSSATAQSVYRSGGTDYVVGGTQTVGTTTYTSYPDIQGHDPNISGPWTIAAINAAQFGVKRIT